MQDRFGRNRNPRLGTWLPVIALAGLGTIWLATTQMSKPDNVEASIPSEQFEAQIVRQSQPGNEGESFVKWFSDGHDDDRWYRSDFDMVDLPPQVGWSADHVTFANDAAHLWITDKPSPTNPYTSGEYQKRGWYGFGRYEVVMKAAQGSGLVSSFFTHTGNYFGDPHDEIDFEFLGKDTRRVWLNWFNDGIVGESKWHRLSFDAAEDFHLYAFEWTPETIRWHVDGELIYERPEGSLPVPVTPGRIIVNLWTGREAQYKWHGEPDFEFGSNASYQCVSYQSPDDRESPQCSDGWPLLGKNQMEDHLHDASE